MKKIISIVTIISFLLTSINTKAQVTKVTLQASGLTCSMCSNAINKSLKSLDFVDKVTANIKNSSFEISFKPGASFDIDKIKNAVEDAGFSVASFTAAVKFDKQAVQNDNHVTINGLVFHFLNTKDQVIDGTKTIRILDKGFVSAKEYKKNGQYTLMECYKTGVAGACCSKDGLTAGTRVYHVSI